MTEAETMKPRRKRKSTTNGDLPPGKRGFCVNFDDGERDWLRSMSDEFAVTQTVFLRQLVRREMLKLKEDEEMGT